MFTADSLIATMDSFVGMTESPPGSNRTPIGEEYGWNGVAWCLTGDTLVRVPEGLKRIDKLDIYDMVLDKDLNKQTIERITQRMPDRLLSIKFQGGQTRVTPEHPYWAKKNNDSDPEWVEAGDLRRGYRIAIPVESSEGIIHRLKSEAYLIGRWIGDGWITKSGRAKRVLICSSYDEADVLAEAILAAGYNACRSNRRTVVEFQITSTDLYTRLLEFYSSDTHKADTKRIAPEVFNWNNNSIEHFLNGYADADGSYSVRQGLRISSVSRELIYGAAILYRRLGNTASIYYGIRPKKSIIENRIINQRDSWQLSIQKANIPNSNVKIDDSNTHWVLVREVNDVVPQLVYDLTVSQTHSFIADGVAVHNCAETVSVACNRNDFPLHTAAVIQIVQYAKQGWNGMGWTRNPTRGAAVCFDWTGRGDPNQMHTGLVYEVLGGGQFRTIEGNYKDRCDRWLRDMRYVNGFATFPFNLTPDPGQVPIPPPPEKEEDMVCLVQGDGGDQAWYVTDFITKRHVATPQEAAQMIYVVTAAGGKFGHANGNPMKVPQSLIDSIPVAK